MFSKRKLWLAEHAKRGCKYSVSDIDQLRTLPIKWGPLATQAKNNHAYTMAKRGHGLMPQSGKTIHGKVPIVHLQVTISMDH